MLGLHVHFLTGRYAATAYNDRSAPEWPPHPARVFSALVDALHSEDAVDPEEARALDVLASLGDPLVVGCAAHQRRVMTSFVPVNDVAVTDAATLAKREGKLRAARAALMELPDDAPAKQRSKAQKALDKARADLARRSAKEAQAGKIGKENPGPAVLPWNRGKQPRTFPVALPVRNSVSFLYQLDTALDQTLASALQQVAARVVRLGHSSSFVRIAVDAAEPDLDAADAAVWRPDPDGEEVLRLPLEEQRALLDREFERHGGDLPGRVMPARHVRYTQGLDRPDVGTTRRTDGRWIVYHLQGQQLPPAHAAVPVAEAVRAELLAQVGGAPDPVLSGLQDGRPAHTPHLAIVPLPFVGHRHADGAIRGFALSMPAAAGHAGEQALLRALGTWEQGPAADDREVAVPMGGITLRARRIVDPADALKSLRRSRWAGPSRTWATVTPLALDGNCSPLRHRDGSIRRKAQRTADKLVRRAAARAVVPPDGRTLVPDEVEVSLLFDPPVHGAAALRSVPRYQRPGHQRPRRLVHALLRLPFPVRGPLVLGSGRHFGLGLCIPLSDREESR